MTTNRVYQGVSSRSQIDPESFVVEVEQPKRGVRIETGLEEKWKSDPVYQTKNSITIRKKTNLVDNINSVGSVGSSDSGSITSKGNSSRHKTRQNQQSNNSVTGGGGGSTTNTEEDDDNFSTNSYYEVDEMFTNHIIESIGRRSSAVARVLPTLPPSVCDSPVKLRFVSNPAIPVHKKVNK